MYTEAISMIWWAGLLFKGSILSIYYSMVLLYSSVINITGVMHCIAGASLSEVMHMTRFNRCLEINHELIYSSFVHHA